MHRLCLSIAHVREPALSHFVHAQSVDLEAVFEVTLDFIEDAIPVMLLYTYCASVVLFRPLSSEFAHLRMMVYLVRGMAVGEVHHLLCVGYLYWLLFYLRNLTLIFARDLG